MRVVATTTPRNVVRFCEPISAPWSKKTAKLALSFVLLKMHGSGFANSLAHVSVGFREILTFKPHFGYPYNDLREERPVNLSFTE
jgi:hypothetical protein